MPDAMSVDAHIAALPDDRRAVMTQLRETIRSAATGATEVMAYNMPAFRLGRRFLVSYDAYKGHTSLFPASQAVRDALGAELFPYLSGKGTIRFPAGQPIPLNLVTWVVQVRLTEVAASEV
jgi:uncharacterized protein YdhG (YjbR/CyaY superfamily)